MKRLLLILLILNAILMLPAPLAVLVAAGLVPELPSWPHDLIIRNSTGQQIRVTPICVRPDGSPRRATLYPDRQTHRRLARVGGLPVPPGATANFVYEREGAELAVLIVEDAQGRLGQMPAPVVAGGEPVTIEVHSLDQLASMSPQYARVFNEAQQPVPRLRWPLMWFMLPCLTFMMLVIAYRRAK